MLNILSETVSRAELEKEYVHYRKLKSKFLVREYLFRKLHDEGELEEELEDIANRVYDNQGTKLEDLGFHLLNDAQQKIKDRFGLPDNINRIVSCSDEMAIEFYNFCKKLGPNIISEYSSYGVKGIEERIKNKKTPDGLQRLNATFLCKIFNSEKIILRGFANWHKDDFISWFKREAKKGCAYCHCNVHELLCFYSIVNPKSGRGLSWEIDRRKPAGNYSSNNCAIACYYCNSAKSDVFDDKQFMDIGKKIGEKIKESIKLHFPS